MDRIFITSIIFCVILTGCGSVNRIRDYSTSSLNTLKKYEELAYTFDKACRHKCYLEQVKSSSLMFAECRCDQEQTADSITSVFYKTIKGYYDGLTRLSGNELTRYKTQGFARELKSGRFGDLKIDKAETDAYAKLSALFLKAVSEGYRRKKLTKFIEEANEPVKILINALSVNLTSNLAGKLNVHRERTQSMYFDFLNDSISSGYEKKRIIDDYNMQVQELDLMHKQISTFAKGLKSVGAGHQKMYDHRNKINAKEMKEILAEYASDLEDIISDFNKLKSK